MKPPPLLALAAFTLLIVAPTRADTSPPMRLHSGPAQWEHGECAIPLSVEHPLDPSLTHFLRRGVPARLDVTVELWRARSSWFDQLMTSQAYNYRVQYDLWRDRFAVRLPQGREVETTDSLQVERLLDAPVLVHVLRLSDTRPSARYYVVARATLSPLSTDDLKELETWMLGSGSGEGMLSTGGYMRAFLRSVVGVDARTATMRGDVFQLPPLPLSAAPSVHDER